jgi:hypothetical protein
MESENPYKRGKIYKLISNQTDLVYYGSTIEVKLSSRLSGHRRDLKRWLNKKFAYVSSFEIIKFDDAKIILVENYPCNTKYELISREQWYIDNMDCVNKRGSCIGSNIEDYRKQYYKNNKTQITEKHKSYYESHKKEIYEKAKEFYKDHKEAIDEKRNKRCSCECGKVYTHHHRSDHFKTRWHQNHIDSLKTT